MLLNRKRNKLLHIGASSYSFYFYKKEPIYIKTFTYITEALSTRDIPGNNIDCHPHQELVTSPGLCDYIDLLLMGYEQLESTERSDV